MCLKCLIVVYVHRVVEEEVAKEVEQVEVVVVVPVALPGAVVLPEEAVGAGQASVLAGQGGLDVLEGGQLAEVSQRRHRRLAAQHLGRDALDVAGRHVAWQPTRRHWRRYGDAAL